MYVMKKTLIISILALGLGLSEAALAITNSQQQIVWTNALQAQKNPQSLNNGNLKIILNDHYLLDQATASLETLQQQSVMLHSLTITAEDGLTDNLTSKFLNSAASVLNQDSLFDVGSGVGMSTDPDTTASLMKFPVGTIRIESTAYQSAYSAVSNVSVPRIDIIFGSVDQVDAFNRAALIGGADFTKQNVNFQGDVITINRLTSNLIKPTTKTMFKATTYQFMSGMMTPEAGGYLGASIGHTKSMTIRFDSAVKEANAKTWTGVFVTNMQTTAQKMPIATQLAIYHAKGDLDVSHIANAFAALRAEQPFIFATNDSLSQLDLAHNQYHYGIIETNAKNAAPLFKAVQEGTLGGVVVQSTQDNHWYDTAIKAPTYLYGKQGQRTIIGAAANPYSLLLYAHSLKPDTKWKKVTLAVNDNPAIALQNSIVGDELKIAKTLNRDDFAKLDATHIPYLSISSAQGETTIIRLPQ